MKNKKIKKRLYVLGVLAVLCILSYSCLSDNPFLSNAESDDGVVTGDNVELTVEDAECWYNSIYLPVSKIRFSNFQEEVLIKPNWAEAKERRQGEFEIVETPLLAKQNVILMDSATHRNDLKISEKRIRNITRMVVRKNLKTGQISNFIMIIRGTYDYLSKSNQIGKNNFFHREPDFDGDVYFYELGQGLMSGYRCKSGKAVSQITLGTEDDSYVATRNTGEDCHLEEVQVEVGESCNTYEDLELGISFPICSPVYSTQWVLVCNTSDPNISKPTNPSEPNQYPGYPSSSYPPLSRACEKADRMTNDIPFMTKVFKGYSIVLDTDPDDFKRVLSTYGSGGEWMGWNDQYFHKILPTIYNGDGKRRSFSEKDLKGMVFDEWLHWQAKPGIGIPLLEDLKEMAELFMKGRVKRENFIYGIISTYGCLCLMITDEGGSFDSFSSSLNGGYLDNEYYKCIQAGEGKSEEQRIGLFIKFLDDNTSGLTVIFAYPDNFSMNAFWAQLVDQDNNMIDNSCR